MNLPNKLSVIRIALAFVFMFILMLPGFWPKVLALLCFSLASFTDFLDGYIARTRNLITDFGKLVDPLADKILITAAFVSFVELGLVSAWMVVVIIAREFCVTGLRLIAASKHVVIPASASGKHKTVSQFVTVIVLLLIVIVREYLIQIGVSAKAIHELDYWFFLIILVFMLVTVSLTIISGYVYLFQHRNLILEE